MKRVFALVVLLLVASMLVMPVFAASANMSVSVSKSTVNRGDTITVTVSTSAVESCFSGGFMFSYNKDVFTYVSGSSLVGGFAMSGVSPAAGNVSGYFMNTSGGTNVSGNLFQITLKVKDSAAYGTYTISGSASMSIWNGEKGESIGCSAGAATVTVACNHSYGSVTKLDDNQHGKTCANCGNVEKEDHKWGSDKVIKAATCREGGQIQQTCSVCSATRTVNTDPTTDHKYGSVTKLDDNQHGKTCSVCGDVQKEGHKWDAGKVNKNPTCKDEGEKTHTCSVCKATKTERIPVDPTAHSYGSVTKLDDDFHGKTCANCGDAQKESHSWKVTSTKAATCKDEGEKTHTCSVCKATKTEPLPVDPTAHSYGAVTRLDDDYHGKTCANCGDVQKESHGWKVTSTKAATCKDEGVKTSACSVCKATKTEPIPVDPNAHKYGSVTKLDDHEHGKTCANCGDVQKEAHQYKTTWSKDRNEHWHECSGCKDKIDVAPHTPGAAATETRAQVCTTCNYVIQPALGHKHSYATNWTTDEKGHWYVCSGCEEKGSYADHDFENACDPDCSVCGYTREIEHVFEDKWFADENKHWHECSECGLKQDEAAHEPGAAATATEPQVCLVCQYELAPALGVQDTTAPTEAATVPTIPAGQDDTVDTTFPWWIIAAMAVAAVGVVILLPKKKK